MTELTQEHFELHTKNKAEQYERQKIKFLEDRITTLEKSIERLNKIVSIWKLGQEDKDDIEIYESVGGGFNLDEEKNHE